MLNLTENELIIRFNQRWGFMSLAKKIDQEVENDNDAILTALNRTQAVIEFKLDGTILHANDNFLQALGYEIAEIKGKHHRIFCEDTYIETPEYKRFWKSLEQGKTFSGEFKRITREGKDIWINASYNPIFGDDGKPYKVVKFATDVTEQKRKQLDQEGQISAIHKSQAVIEFNLDGTILSANENFLKTLGYDISEIEGKHHKMFCDEKLVETSEYSNFWKDLSRGEFKSGEFRRIDARGNDVWINATYNPIIDSEGQPFKVVKFASDITASKMRNSEYEGKLAAISKSQAVIEFNLDGTILTANENFLATLGYSLSEIEGQHHRIFCESDYAGSMDYKRFWDSLSRGEFHSGEFMRVTKEGEEIWINATYNPIFDASGKPFKVVKFATDITKQKIRSVDFEGQIKAIDTSQAVIEFEPSGTILNANENFLSVTGYKLEEIVGQHHRIFCDTEYVNTQEYKEFWNKLGRGEFDSGEYKRFSKSGGEVWINASYNPVFDLKGNVYKVVKYATDLTKEKEAYNNLVDSFEKAAESLRKTSEGIQGFAQNLSDDAQGTLELSRQALVNSEEVNQGVQTVSTSTEEMSASIKELSRSASETSSLAQDASEKSKSTCEVIADLGKASEDIGNVIKVINSIAQQTNLLALNATIEAARAGEAGKGFAVVANEVKELAKQTALATDNISNQIGNVQQSTSQAVTGVEVVASKITQLSEISLTTASAVEEQAQTTSSMSQVLLEQNSSVGEISKLIEQVTNSANKSFNGAQDSLKSAQELNSLATKLRQLVDDAKR